MLLSAHAGSASSRSQLESGEAYQQINASQQLAQSLAETATKHNQHLKGEPDGNSVAVEQMAQSGRAIAGVQSGATQYSEPQLQISGAAGIAAVTPSSAILSAQLTSSMCAGQDVNLVSGQNLSSLVANGLGMFTYGKVEGKTRPNQETGIRMHAASGKLSMQSQSGRTSLVADKAVTVASVSASVTVSAPKKHVLLTAGGAGIKLEGGGITIQGPGSVHFKASMKELAGPVSVPSAELAMKVHELQLKRDLEIEYVDADGNALTGEPIDLRFASGDSKTVTLGNDGRATLKDAPLGPFGAKQPKRR
jgi:type VI secretion system secreted protein VgrG